ncbi:hypothetical protein H4S14_002475 [Agrobacterium vitis]|nr:hypothetical protein [Agrobacterium vitis]MBE1438719.1 hypothetical protein [Agrobacterium vitis]
MNVHIKNTPSGHAPQPEDIAHFMQILSCVPNVQTACWMGAEFLGELPPEVARETTVALSHVHPFFLPKMKEGDGENGSICLGQFADFVLQARLTANRTNNTNLLVASMPGSASTFVANSLRKALGLRTANLVSMAYSDYSASLFGANLNSKELDELALQRNGLDRRGYVAQHAVLCTPYIARQMTMYRIRPIVTTRNFFSTLASTDDTLMAARTAQASCGDSFFDDGMPACYQDLPFDARLDLLVDAQAIWYAQFLTGWKKCEAQGQIKPLWISYERDILGHTSSLAEKIAGFIGDDQIDAITIADALAQEDKDSVLEESAIPASIRQRAMTIFQHYAGDTDFSDLIGG